MNLEDFANLPIAIKAQLLPAHVATVRMYTGKFFRPWNQALRALVGAEKGKKALLQLKKWATCVSVLYDAILRLSSVTSAMVRHMSRYLI